MAGDSAHLLRRLSRAGQLLLVGFRDEVAPLSGGNFAIEAIASEN